jgi:site-specific DNA-methyltransferase (adenine-specific)
MIDNFRNMNLVGNALDVLKTLPDGIVSCVMTSPPYWSLRKYKTPPLTWDGSPSCDHSWTEIHAVRKATPGDIPSKNSILHASSRSNSELRPGESSGFCTKCGAWKGHLGLEPSPDLYVKHLCDIFDEVKRVLRDDGTCWVNIGDSYGGSGGAGGDWQHGPRAAEEKWKQVGYDVPQKSMVMIPERFILEMVKRGWILRQKIPWVKLSPMPSSVTDRFTSSWEPIYFFVKNQKYWFEQQFKPLKCPKAKGNPFGGTAKGVDGYCNPQYSGNTTYDASALVGANMRDVWVLNTSKTREGHFATYPIEVCMTPIKAGCPREICPSCGKPRYPVLEVEGRLGESWHDHGNDAEQGAGQSNGTRGANYKNIQKKQVGYSDCGCNAGFVPGIVLDPFMGTGTTAIAAQSLGRDYLGIELSDEYKAIIDRRLAKKTNTRLEAFA